MVSKESGLCLEDPNGDGTPSRQPPGTLLWQEPCNGQAKQNWAFLAQSNGYFVVENQAATENHGSPMVIDDYNGSNQHSLQMWLYPANGQARQNWRLNIQ